MKEIIKFGDIDKGALEQAERCLDEAEAFALMADNHKGYGMPVGGVAVYKNKISPAGVGFDIACGNKAVKLNVFFDDIKDVLPEIARKIADTLSFGVGRKNNETVEHELFDSELWDIDFYKDNPKIKELAREQLGTIGSGNHYVDVFKDENDAVWVGVHFGSRGLGHKTASHFMQLAGDNVNIFDEIPHCLDVNSKDGKDYLSAMTLAGMYAYAGRDWVCQKVAEIIGEHAHEYTSRIQIIEEIHNHHNFAWKETHNGEEYYVVRKGATPAFPDQYGFVGGSMGDNAVIIKGIDSELSKSAFYSTIHGAGRIMSRTQAAGKSKWMHGKKVRDRSGLVHWGNAKQAVSDNGTILIGGGADEAPEVYKRLPEVLQYHAGTIEIIHQLKPLIVVMAGEDEFDPYKD